MNPGLVQGVMLHGTTGGEGVKAISMRALPSHFSIKLFSFTGKSGLEFADVIKLM